jgi:hypothetical protein
LIDVLFIYRFLSFFHRQTARAMRTMRRLMILSDHVKAGFVKTSLLGIVTTTNTAPKNSRERRIK